MIKILLVIVGMMSVVPVFSQEIPASQVSTSSVSQGPSVRIKDMASILEARDNQLFGFGLVVGLRNTEILEIQHLLKMP